MNSFRIVISDPWLLLLILPVASIVLFPFLRLPARRRNTPKRIIPVVLHIIVSITLVALLSGVSVIAKENTQSVLILLDLSDSTEDVQQDITESATDILARFDSDTQVGVLAFAGDTIYEVKLEDKDKSISYTNVASSATDIAGALEYAASILPTDTNRRIILLSDGKQTDGDAESTASNLAKQGIRIDAHYFETTYLDSDEVQVSDLAMPNGAYAGDEIEITVTLESNITADVHLTLYDGSAEVTATDVALAEGSNTLTLTTVVEKSGVHTFSVTITSDDDTILNNNTMYSYINVAGAADVLIIANTTQEAAELETLLADEYNVTVVTSGDAPNTTIGLCNYDKVILVNVDAEDLPSGFGDLLSTYVSDYGRSVLTVGGTDTYMYGNMEDTVLEEMMPVTLSLTDNQEGQSVAVMLVLDCSMSMSQQSTNLSLAKQGAVKSIEAMSENDYVGIISFNRTASVMSPLIQATDSNKDSLNRIVSSLTTSQGTYYAQALQLAYEELMKSDVDVKHVIFLSDGNPSDSGYETTVKNMSADGITVSTISIGYSSSILSSLADTGGGRYYYVASASDLPDIMLSETEQVSVSSMITENVTPKIVSDSALTEGVDPTTIPSLDGYLGVTLKEDADCLLETEDGNPIYAVWQYGVGTVASFMSDLSGNWSAAWLADETGQLLTSRMVGTTIDSEHDDSSLTAEITKGGAGAFVSVNTATVEANQTISISAASPDGSANTYQLHEVTPGTYEGTVATGSVGVYELMIVQYDSEGEVADYLKTALAVSYSAEYDAFMEGGEDLLTGVCGFSGGIISDDAATLANIEMEPLELVKDPFVPLGILTGLLILADIAIRKLRWKDIIDLYKRFRYRTHRADV